MQLTVLVSWNFLQDWLLIFKNLCVCHNLKGCKGSTSISFCLFIYFLFSFNVLWFIFLCARLSCIITVTEFLMGFTLGEVAVFLWKFSYLFRGQWHWVCGILGFTKRWTYSKAYSQSRRQDGRMQGNHVPVIKSWTSVLEQLMHFQPTYSWERVVVTSLPRLNCHNFIFHLGSSQWAACSWRW